MHLLIGIVSGVKNISKDTSLGVEKVFSNASFSPEMIVGQSKVITVLLEKIKSCPI
jgi:hypothetical protein